MNANEQPPAAQDVFQSAGWISLDGVFYACIHGGHACLAQALTEMLWNDSTGEYTLERLGWIRVLSDGTLGFNLRVGITQAQLDALYDLEQASSGCFQRHIGDMLQLLAGDDALLR